MSNVWGVIIIVSQAVAIGLLLRYLLRKDKEFEQTTRKMNDKINRIIRYTENKQKEITRIKNKSSKLNETKE